MFKRFMKKIINCKFMKITGEIIIEIFFNVLDFIKSNLRNMSIILRVVLPYFMWYIGIYLYNERGKFVVGGEVFIPIVILSITYYFRQYANKIGKGEKIPIPNKRFTEEGSENGEITVETSRMEEMVLYMADLEDYLQRKGLLRNK